jgi:hypothetical protein
MAPPQKTTRHISLEEEEEVHEIEKLFAELTTYRNLFAGQWEECANILETDSRNTFFYGSYNFPGQKKMQRQVDATGRLALSQFCAITDSLITPKNRRWHALQGNDYVMKDRATRIYFDQVRELLFNHRYRPAANFHAQNYSNWKSLGAFGNSIMYVDELDIRLHPGERGLRYKAVPLGECFWAENHQGLVTTLIRWFRLTAEQAYQKFGEDWLPPTLWPALEQNLQTPFQFLHCVKPRDDDDFNPDRLDAKGMPFESNYMSIEGKCLMAEEGGYRTFPYAVSRYDQMPNEQYGRGPAQLVLPALKTLNAQKSVFLKTGHRASDPVYLVSDDGLIDFDQTPGAINKGGVSPDGKPMVHVLPTGDIQISEKMMGEERGLIEGHFLTSLFKVLTENPNMTATQVVELLNERGMLVAPTLGRQHSEYVGSLVPREIDILGNMGQLPRMPPRLREANGYYEIKDTSPLAQAAEASKAAGFMRWVEFLRQVAVDTQDPSVMDRVNFDAASPEIARINDVPEDWVADDKMVADKRKARSQSVARKQQLDALPAQAAMVKANAVAAKTGVGPGGQPQQPGTMP